jgi:hypothetical protein
MATAASAAEMKGRVVPTATAAASTDSVRSFLIESGLISAAGADKLMAILDDGCQSAGANLAFFGTQDAEISQHLAVEAQLTFMDKVRFGALMKDKSVWQAFWPVDVAPHHIKSTRREQGGAVEEQEPVEDSQSDNTDSDRS